MALPDFDDLGNLPPGRHAASVEDIKQALVDPFPESHARRAIFDWWCDLRAGLLELGGVIEFWLAGSYVTRKHQPNDMDVGTLLGGPTFDAMPPSVRSTLTVVPPSGWASAVAARASRPKPSASALAGSVYARPR